MGLYFLQKDRPAQICTDAKTQNWMLADKHKINAVLQQGWRGMTLASHLPEQPKFRVEDPLMT